ncbi:hypothetical protein PSPO01_04376 [Paraphaeosphaeria sporulosa]
MAPAIGLVGAVAVACLSRRVACSRPAGRPSGASAARGGLALVAESGRVESRRGPGRWPVPPEDMSARCAGCTPSSRQARAKLSRRREGFPTAAGSVPASRGQTGAGVQQTKKTRRGAVATVERCVTGSVGCICAAEWWCWWWCSAARLPHARRGGGSFPIRLVSVRRPAVHPARHPLAIAIAIALAFGAPCGPQPRPRAFSFASRTVAPARPHATVAASHKLPTVAPAHPGRMACDIMCWALHHHTALARPWPRAARGAWAPALHITLVRRQAAPSALQRHAHLDAGCIAPAHHHRDNLAAASVHARHHHGTATGSRDAGPWPRPLHQAGIVRHSVVQHRGPSLHLGSPAGRLAVIEASAPKLEAAPPPVSPAPHSRVRPSSREFQEACVRASSRVRPTVSFSREKRLCHPSLRGSPNPQAAPTKQDCVSKRDEHPSPLLSCCWQGLDASCSLPMHVGASALIRAVRYRDANFRCKPKLFKRIRTLCTCLRSCSSPLPEHLAPPSTVGRESHGSNVAELHAIRSRFGATRYTGAPLCAPLCAFFHI